MSIPFRRIHVVINPASGKNEPILNTLNAVFHEYGIQWDVSITHDNDQGQDQARAAVEGGADLVVAYGGDGTIMTVANGLIDTGIPLAIFPGGTGNVIANELGIPINLKKAAQMLCSPQYRLRTIDVGRVQDRIFLLRADVGAPAKLAADADREMKNRFGIGAYFISAIKTLRNVPRGNYRVNVDGEELECEGIACLVANMGSIGALNLKLGPQVSPSDGLLDVFVVAKGLDSMLSVVTNIVADMAHLREIGASLIHMQGREVTINLDPPQDVIIDAEFFGQTPLKVSVMPKAMRVVVPVA